MVTRVPSSLLLFAVLFAPASAHAELFSKDLPALESTYGGIGGDGRTSTFDFNRSFLEINNFWLHLVGGSAMPGCGLNDLLFEGLVDGQSSGEDWLFEVEDEFEMDVPLVHLKSILDGEGVITLYITSFNDCVDASVGVTDATLWLSGIAAEEPIPAISPSGLGLITLAMIAVGTIVIGRPRRSG
ncbi:MAG: hypothetical protein ACYTFA_18670 [Planctomycetota bacterium]|jgi:hypothetical protein